jgi:hypothetical protein
VFAELDAGAEGHDGLPEAFLVPAECGVGGPLQIQSMNKDLRL